jgi:hypothetical protein
MPVNQDVMSDRQFYALAHPLQNRRFYLALVFAILLFPLIAAGLVIGTIVLVVPLFAFLIWLGARVLFARYVGNSILVSEKNYPRINVIAEKLKRKMGYQKPIYIFVYEHGNFNTYLMYMFFRRAIFLNSELLEKGVSDDEVSWLIGRFIGYLRARRQAGVLGWIIRAAQHLIVFNIFLLPYERAMVYTGDRLAVAAIGGDISSAISAMQKLFVGRQLGYSVNPEGIIEQQRLLKGSMFAFLARLMTGFPHMTSRYIDLIVFSKNFYPAQFTVFQAANPGLPDDLPSLAALAGSRTGGSPEDFMSKGRPPHGPAWAVATVAVVLAIGALGWSRIERPVDRDPSGAAGPIATAPTYAAPSPAPLPPHVHRREDGELAPDPGCHWMNNAPNDFRVRCG